MKDISKTKKQLIEELTQIKKEFKKFKLSFKDKLKLKYGNSHLATVVQFSSDAIYTETTDGYIITWNKSAEKIYGYKAKEIIGKPVSILTPPENKSEIGKILKKIKKRKLVNNFETTILKKNKEKLVISITVSPVKNEKGKIIAALVIGHNIAQQKEIEKIALEAEKKYRDIVNYAPIAIVRTNRKGEILAANMAFARMLGYSSIDEVLKLNVEKDVYFDRKIRRKIINQYQYEGLVSGVDILLRKKNGKNIWAHLNSHVIRNSNRTELYFESFLSDITKQMEAQQIVMEQEQSYRSLIDSSIDPIYVLKGRRLQLVNPAWTKLFGYSEEEAYSESFDIIKIIAPESRVMIEKRINSSLNPKFFDPSIYEMSGLTKSGKIIKLEVSWSKIMWNGKIAIQGIYRDITERKQHEELLIQAKKNAENSDKLKTEFLAQMSHEIRTPLNNILTYLSLLKDELEDKLPEDLQSVFPVIENSSHRLIRTIDLILNLSKIQSGNFETKFEKIDLDKDVIEDITIEFFQRAKNKNLELQYENKSENNLILGDKYTVSQIFLNLIENAIKFTEKGSIKILIDSYKNKTRVSIIDTGIGISQEYREYIFKPFSQENVDKNRYYPGIGLGLSLIKKYVEINNAGISVASTKGKGSTFTVIFEPLTR